MEQKFCQSCGMPLTEDVLGTNADGSKNEEYCVYCYKDGRFLQECTMEEMAEFCAQYVDEFNNTMYTDCLAEYIDLSEYLVRDGYSTIDGVHFDSATSQKIYNYCVAKAGRYQK